MTTKIIDVQPLRDKRDIEAMKQTLRDRFTQRDYIMFLVGINTGLRMGDILRLKTSDVLSLKNKKNKHLTIAEGKTSKARTISFKAIYKELYEYAMSNKSEWLFPSREGDRAISVTQAYRILNKCAWWNDIESVGTHTLRKTYAYHLYKQTGDVALIQNILNHSSPDITLKYIGISTDEINNAMDSFSL